MRDAGLCLVLALIHLPRSDNSAKADAFASTFARLLDEVLARPSGPVPLVGGPVDVTSLCLLRERCIQDAGFSDIFKPVKDEENDTALTLLPGVLRELDAETSPALRWMLALKGVFAGNIFDLGSAASADRFESGMGSFHATRKALLPRPWSRTTTGPEPAS